MSIWLSQFDLPLMSRSASKVVMLCLLVILAWLLGIVVTDQLKQPIQLGLPTLQNTPPAQFERKITNAQPRYLLGKQTPQTVNSSTKSSKSSAAAVVTKLNLKVLGILSMSGDKGVIIVQSGSKTSLVSTGEEIQRGVVLQAIFPDYVEINHKGKIEKIIMASNNALLKGLTTSENKMVLGSKQSTTISRLSQELRRSPMKITQYVRFQMVSEAGKVIAIQVWPKRDKEIFSALGFKSGDILKKVNGLSIEEVMRRPILWQKMLKKNTFDMEVERLGSIESFVVNLNQG